MPEGQVLTGSFMDYGMPRAARFCPPHPCSEPRCRQRPIRSASREPARPGTVGALPAVMSAIMDALAPLGIEESTYRPHLPNSAGDRARRWPGRRHRRRSAWATAGMSEQALEAGLPRDALDTEYRLSRTARARHRSGQGSSPLLSPSTTWRSYTSTQRCARGRRPPGLSASTSPGRTLIGFPGCPCWYGSRSDMTAST